MNLHPGDIIEHDVNTCYKVNIYDELFITSGKVLEFGIVVYAQVPGTRADLAFVIDSKSGAMGWICDRNVKVVFR
jgi:hypothetical protein